MDAASHTLVATKLSRPYVRTDMVLRQRLIDRLNHGLERRHPLTLVCAGAGFGKTTLISAWIDGLTSDENLTPKPQAVWLSLDKHDSELTQFLHYFIAALHTVFPAACANTEGLLKRWPEPRLAVLLATLSNDILSLPEPVILVLDDYHSLSGTAVHDLFNGLLYHWPKSLHLVIISRHTPPLPITSLRAKREITEIRNQDLRFTPEEIAEYVKQMWPVSLNQSGLKVLQRKTEGWVAGLQLASLSLRMAENVEAILNSLAGTNTEIAEYLTEVVLSRQPQAFQTFLLKTSLLDQFNVPLCEAIGANEDPDWSTRAILDWLVHGNLFVISLDNKKKWYRFHSLLRDLLQQKVKEKFEWEQVATIHRDAAIWFAKSGLIDAAIRHALQAQDLQLAANLMEQELCRILNREDRRTLERWLSLMPEAFIDTHPGLLMIQAWSLHFSWQIEAVSLTLQKVETLLDQGAIETHETTCYQTLQGQIATLKSMEVFNKEQPALSMTHAYKALALLPPSWTYGRGGVMLYLALSMQAVGEGGAVEKQLLELYGPLYDKTNGYALRLLMALCLIYLQAGQLEKTMQTAEHLLQQAVQYNLKVLQGWAHFFLGLVYYQWNLLDAAGAHFKELIAKRYQIHSLTACHGFAGLILVHLAAGRLEKALKTLDLFCNCDMELNGRLTDVAQAVRARTLLAAGKAEEAARWADSYTTSAKPMVFILLELPQLTRAQILLARETQVDVSQPLHILENLNIFAEQNHNIRRQIEILAVQAVTLDTQGNVSAAKAALKQAIELARPGGFIRVFVDRGSRLQKILKTLTVSPTYTEFVQQILLAFPTEPAVVDTVHRNNGTFSQAPTSLKTFILVESLTNRETQVLTFLREPLSVKEIALKLNITHSTVKRHTINIYGKLGVNSRWDAVARAEALKILSPR